MFRGILGALALAAAVVPATAATIITISPAGCGGGCLFRGQPESESWSQSVTYTGVTITANLFDSTAGTPATGTAYLTTQIGPGTTNANEVGGSAEFNISTTNTTSTAITLFSGLTLGPGTYFLTINSTSSNATLIWDGGAGEGSNTASLGTGVSQSLLPDSTCCSGPLDPYPPADNWKSPKANVGIFSVTGILSSTPTPEPITGVMVLAGLCGLVLAKRRFR